MTVRTSATTTLKISAGVPATFNEAGYVALTYTTVGEVVNLGDFGREFELVMHKPVAQRGTVKLKGGHNEGSIALELGLDTDDAGQILLKSASLSDSLHAYLITTPIGDKYYFQGLAMGFKVGVKGVNDVTSATVNIEISTSSTGVGIVETLI